LQDKGEKLSSPIKYTDRTFLTIRNSIDRVATLADKPEWFKDLVSGVGDVISFINNAQANNSYLGTAFTRQAVVELCRLIGYELPSAKTSLGTMLFYFPSTVSFPFTVAAEDLVGTTRGTVAISAKRFEARAGVTFTAETDVVDITSNPPSSNRVLVARDFLTGEKVRLTTAGVLPTGLAEGRDYFIVRHDATHVGFALTVVEAFAGTEVTISDGSGNMTLHLYSGRATCYQQEAKALFSLGASDGVTAWQEYQLPDLGLLDDTLVISVNGTPWAVVDTLALSKSYEAHYQLVFDSKGYARIRFGDGTYGAIPGNFDVMTSYSIGGGAASNVTALNSISVYAGKSANISGCSNATTFTGGADAQSIETAKNTAPGTLKSRDRFVTAEDGEALALGYGGLSLVRVIPNAFGVLSAQVVGIAIGGGNPNSTLKTNLQAYLIERTVFGDMDIRVQDATITSHNVTAAAKILAGFTWAGVRPFFRLAWKILLAETGQEILDVYKSDGIAAAVDRINTIYSEAFAAADYSKIQQLLDALFRFGAADFGVTLQESDAIALIQGFVDGIDYFTYSAPTFPIVPGASEISTYGTLTLTEIT
jgi:hypothetical protein